MPLYFMHIRSGDDLIADEEGIILSDLSAAREDAVRGARDILAEKVRAGEELDGDVIEITDIDGKILDTVKFLDTTVLHFKGSGRRPVRRPRTGALPVLGPER